MFWDQKLLQPRATDRAAALACVHCRLAAVGLQLHWARLFALLFKSTMSNMPGHARQSTPARGLPKHAACLLLYILMPHPSKGMPFCEHTPSACDGNYSSSALSVSNDGLNGVLPTELGLLTDLRSISAGLNSLSGSIPTQLGQLSSLLAPACITTTSVALCPPRWGSLRS